MEKTRKMFDKKERSPKAKSQTAGETQDLIAYPRFKRTKCTGCGECIAVCDSEGFSALSLNKNKQVMINTKKCSGCKLCLNVCKDEAIILLSPRKRRMFHTQTMVHESGRVEVLK